MFRITKISDEILSDYWYVEYTVPVYFMLCLFFSDKIFAVPFVKKCWDVGKFCVGKVGTFVSDFRNVEGNVSILIERKYFILGHIKLIPVFKFSS